MAGWPVALQMGVKGTKRAARVNGWSGFPGAGSNAPKGGGGSPTVGVSQIS